MVPNIEQLPVIIHPTESVQEVQVVSTSKPFIESNTIEVSIEELRDKHIIPVFVKDNEPLISHAEFIDSTYHMVKQLYDEDTVLGPVVRVSHPIKGRIPEAKDKPANQLLECEKTLFYERMMFVIEIPSYQVEIGGNTLSLTVGGVKSYGDDNLYSRNMGVSFPIFDCT